ncbi:MAG TPA: HD domain-containing protein [Solirubrobacterales bacterium]|nr:HD domain-containing protein [Solirubrobacterales bacterium]
MLRRWLRGSGDHSVDRAAGGRDGCPLSRPTKSAIPEWISSSRLLSKAFRLATRAHGSERRPSGGRLFLEHVAEVAGLLQRLEFDEGLVAVGLLHDSVERGTLSESELRSEMGESIRWLVMALSEDPTIEPFDERKAALRDQVAVAGVRAVTVFAADKLSDIAGLRRGIETSPKAAEARMGASVASMAGHYRDSVRMIAAVRPGSVFLSALRLELERLDSVAAAQSAAASLP